MRRVLLALLVLLAAGCSGPLVRNAPDGEAPSDFPNHSAPEIVRLIEASTRGIDTYRSEARLRIQSPEVSQSVGASLRANVADTLTASLRGPLSLNVGRTLVTADSFFAVDQLNNRYLYGSLGVAERFVPGSGRPGALAQNLLGLIVPAVATPWTVSTDSSLYVLTEPGGQRQYRIDPSVWRVVQLDERDPDGHLLTRRVFEAFDVIDERVVPRRVVLTSITADSEVTVEHQRLTLNPDGLTFRFSVPSDAERIPLD